MPRPDRRRSDMEWWGPRPGRAAWQRTGRRVARRLVVVGTLAPIGLFIAVTVYVTSRSDVPPWVWVILAGLPLGAMLIVAIFGRAAWRTIRPIRDLVAAAGDLADGNYDARVRGGGSMMQPVVESFNRMAERLESAEEQRRRLLADLGHELRTPLTVIRGEVEAILDGIYDPDPDHLESMLTQVGVLERLLDDLRTLSLAEAGTLTLHPEPIDLAAFVEDVADSQRRAAETAGVDLVVATPSRLTDVVLDPVRIREVLTNLVVNALRAMPDGGRVTIGVGVEGNELVMTVADTGVGMSEAQLALAFQRFQRSPDSPGSGLGLTISRDLVEAHGGTIRLDSTPGEGTTATVRLPLRIAG